MTSTACASPGRRLVSAMKAGSPVPGLQEVGQLSARPIGSDQRRVAAPCAIAGVRVTWVQVCAW